MVQIPIFRCLFVNFERIMIAFLQGQFVQVTPAKLIVDVGGVGYEVNISLHTYEAISKKEKGMLHTYLLAYHRKCTSTFWFSRTARKGIISSTN